MLRVRFHANEEDYRPINWPIQYPYWCSGYGEGYAVVIAYAPDVQYIYDNWPEADQLDVDERDAITFSDRFPCPEWYDPNNNPTVEHVTLNAT